MSDKDVLFVSWCGLKLLRPRSLQVGRAGKALRQQGWRPTLICSNVESDFNLFDVEIESWYRPEFAKVIVLRDPDADAQSSHERTPKRGLFARLQEQRWKFRQPPSWANAAKGAINRWARWRRLPIVISFAQPWTSHLAALAAKRKLPRLRWAAHFSDPWVDSPYFPKSTIAEFDAARQQEEEVIRNADAIVFVTEETANLVMQKYPAESRRKVHVIPHLLDLDHSPGPSSLKRTAFDRLRLVHAGSLYEGIRAPMGLFGALQELKQFAQPGDLLLTCHFVGWTGTRIIKYIGDNDLEDCVTTTAPLHYSGSLKEMADADVLMVIDADFTISPFLPSKIFDYLLFDKPILGLTPAGSATANFLNRLGYPCVEPNNVSEIKRVLMTLLETRKAGPLRPTDAHLEARKRYDVRNAGVQYVELVEQLSR